MNFANITIREFKQSDAENCFKIRSEAFIKIFYNHIGADGVVSGVNAYLPESYIKMSESIPIFVAVENDIPIGFIGTRFIDNTSIEIQFLYVNLSYLNKQIGKQLELFFKNWVKSNYPIVTKLIVDTIVPDYNQKFYEKIGYKKIGKSSCKYPNRVIYSIRLEKEL